MVIQYCLYFIFLYLCHYLVSFYFIVTSDSLHACEWFLFFWRNHETKFQTKPTNTQVKHPDWTRLIFHPRFQKYKKSKHTFEKEDSEFRFFHTSFSCLLFVRKPIIYCFIPLFTDQKIKKSKNQNFQKVAVGNEPLDLLAQIMLRQHQNRLQ